MVDQAAPAVPASGHAPKPMWGIAYPDGSLFYSTAFASEEEATSALGRILGAGSSSERLHLRPLTWREREQGRDYTRPVWHRAKWWCEAEDVWRDHYVHVSNTPGLLAYTQDEAKGARDIQTPIKAGRYLRKFFGHILTDRQIALYAAWQTTGIYQSSYDDAGAYPLAFADSADDIEWVYTHGPHSCMSEAPDDYAGPCHPTRVYAAGDLAIAYLTAAAERDRAIARCLVWPERKVAGRIYPTDYNWQKDGFDSAEDAQHAADALRARLVADGYSFGGARAFDGARLRRIDAPHAGFVMPYLDGGYGFDEGDDPDYLVMNRAGGRAADRTDGLADVPRPAFAQCDRCDSDIEDEEDARSIGTSLRMRGGSVRVSNWGTWCPYCADRHAFHCDGIYEDLSDDIDSLRTSDGRRVCEAWADIHCYKSDLSDEFFVSADDPPVELDTGDVWAPAEFAEHGFTCAVTGQRLPKSHEHTLYPGVADDIPDDEAEARRDYMRIEDARQCELAY